jgi:putative transposase
LLLRGFPTVFSHIWFVTKYRRPVLDEETEQKLLAITQEIAERKGDKILEIRPNKDHVHILLELDQRKKLPSVIRTLKAVTAKKIRETTPHLRVGNAFWARRYGYKEVEARRLDVVRKYVREQKRIPHT